MTMGETMRIAASRNPAPDTPDTPERAIDEFIS
jgi:hypothetical protein